MTTGIIQQAFKQLKEYTNRHYKDTAFITLAEQELIENIKQELEECSHFPSSEYHTGIIDYCIILIGDNQE